MLSKRIYAAISGGFLALFLTQPAKTESSSQFDNQTIGLGQALQWANNRNPLLKAYLAETEALKADVMRAGLRRPASINLQLDDVSGSGNYQGTAAAQMSVGIAWFIEGKIREHSQQLAEANSDARVMAIKRKQLDLAAETARLYFLALANQYRYQLAQQTVELAKKTVAEIGKRIKVGRSAELELLRAKAELERAALEVEDIEHERLSSYRLLSAQWGDARPLFSQLDGNIYKQIKPVSYQVLEQNIAQNPEWMEIAAMRNAKQAGLKLEQSKSSPAWQANIGIKHFEATGDQAFMAGLSIPIGERSRNHFGVKKAQAELTELSYQAEALRLRYSSELFVLYQEFQHGLHQIDVFKEKIIPLLEKALAKADRAFELGRYSYMELKSVQSDLLGAKSQLLEVSLKTHIKLIEIERLAGMSLEQPATQKN